MSGCYSIDEIKDIMEEPEVEEITFIMPKKPDRQAAANRAFLAEDLLRSWHSALNDEKCNTHEMPEELLKLYQEACDKISVIIGFEEKLSRR